MSFRITGLSPEPFRHLFGLPDDALVRLGARRVIADATPGFPDRIEMRDAYPGESLILVNHEHLPGISPYRSRHAVYVREFAGAHYDRVDEIPEVLRRRLISLRGFEDMMRDADVVDGEYLAAAIDRLFADPLIVYLHAHNAKPGCFAARIYRAPSADTGT